MPNLSLEKSIHDLVDALIMRYYHKAAKVYLNAIASQLPSNANSETLLATTQKIDSMIDETLSQDLSPQEIQKIRGTLLTNLLQLIRENKIKSPQLANIATEIVRILPTPTTTRTASPTQAQSAVLASQAPRNQQAKEETDAEKVLNKANNFLYDQINSNALRERLEDKMNGKTQQDLTQRIQSEFDRSRMKDHLGQVFLKEVTRGTPFLDEADVFPKFTHHTIEQRNQAGSSASHQAATAAGASHSGRQAKKRGSSSDTLVDNSSDTESDASASSPRSGRR